MSIDEVRTKIEQLENEIKDLEDEKELTNSQEKLDFLDDMIYNTQDSIEKLKKYV